MNDDDNALVFVITIAIIRARLRFLRFHSFARSYCMCVSAQFSSIAAFSLEQLVEKFHQIKTNHDGLIRFEPVMYVLEN